jgi:putative ABC transport system substrate-binding protein
MRRIGVLTGQSEDEPVSQARDAAFLHALQELGWTVGGNVLVEYRWAPSMSITAAKTRWNWSP